MSVNRSFPITRRSMLTASAALGAGLALPRSSRAAGKPIGFIYVGPRMDYGYNYSMDQGRLFVEKALKVKTLSQENVPENAEVTRVMEKMIRAGCEIIFRPATGTSTMRLRLARSTRT